MLRIARWLLRAGLLALTVWAMPAFAQDENSFFGGSGCVALTFDDGPDPVLTPKLLDILAAENVKATFYVIGQRVAAWPGIVRRAYQEGHEIGNHTWDHRELPTLSSAQVETEFSKTDAAIRAATGTGPATIRSPYGSQSARIAEIAAPRPLVLWDTDTLDWLHRDIGYVTRKASHSAAGTIVLFHDIHSPTVEAVPGIIRDLKARGISFVTISDFLAGRCGRGVSIAFQGNITTTTAAAGAKAPGGASPTPVLFTTRTEAWCRKLGLFNPYSGVVTEPTGDSWQCVAPKAAAAPASDRAKRDARPAPIPVALVTSD